MTHPRPLALALATFLLVAPTALAGEWQDLLSGGLEAWNVSESSAHVWRAENGLLIADNREGKDGSVIVSQREVTDFDAEFEVSFAAGRIGLRKWHSFTLYVDLDMIGQGPEWRRIGLSVRGSEVHLYVDLQPATLGAQKFLGGTEHFWLMAEPGALIAFRKVRIRDVEANEPDPFENLVPREIPDLSKAKKLFTGSSFMGWDVRGEWTIEEGAARGKAPAGGDPASLVTGRPNWTDGTIAFEFQGLAEGELLIVFLNYDGVTGKATEVNLPGSNEVDQTAWIPVTIAFRGDVVILWMAGQRYVLERASKLGCVGFGLRPGTECAIRDIRIQLDK